MSKPYEYNEENPFITYNNMKVYTEGVELLVNEHGINADLLKLIQTMQEEHDAVNEVLKEIV